MADSRSIRGTLDAYILINSSNNTGIATRMIWKIRTSNVAFYTGIYQNAGAGIYFGALLAVNKMDDVNLNSSTVVTSSTGSNIFVTHNFLVKGHGISVTGPYNGPDQDPNVGSLASYGSLGGIPNQGLKHYNDTVQFGKGISVGTAPGITNGANTGFISGTSLSEVLESNGTYRTTNIKMSDFYGLKKEDPTNNGYIYNDGNGAEEIVSTGPISVGNAAALSVGGNANGIV